MENIWMINPQPYQLPDELNKYVHFKHSADAHILVSMYFYQAE